MVITSFKEMAVRTVGVFVSSFICYTERTLALCNNFTKNITFYNILQRLLEYLHHPEYENRAMFTYTVLTRMLQRKSSVYS